MQMPFVIMFERPSKDRCCRLPVWFGHDTDVSTLYRFHDNSRLCRCSPDSAQPCSSVQVPTSGANWRVYWPGIMNHYPSATPLEMSEARCRSGVPPLPACWPSCFTAESVRVNAQRSASLSQKSSVNETRSLVPSSQRNSIRQRTTVVSFLS